jgi:phage terminase large subunit-like protein
MEPNFCQLGLAFFELMQVATPARPNTETQEPETAAEWASQKLNFIPSAKQAEVLNLDAKYLILCCNRQWGKTTTIALKALHRALTMDHQSIVIISRTKLQAGILIDRACHFAARLGHRIRRVLGHAFSLKLPNGSSIFAVAHTQDTSVGNTANVLIVDEAALVKDEVYATVSPFVGRTHGAIWLMSTPRRQAGFFYNVWHSVDSRWRKVFSTVKDCPEFDPDFLAMQEAMDPIKYKHYSEWKIIPSGKPGNRSTARQSGRRSGPYSE